MLLALGGLAWSRAAAVQLSIPPFCNSNFATAGLGNVLATRAHPVTPASPESERLALDAYAREMEADFGFTPDSLYAAGRDFSNVFGFLFERSDRRVRNDHPVGGRLFH